MSANGILSLASEVSTVVGAIYGKYQQTQRCRAQCRTLAENIRDIHDPVKKFYASLGKSQDKDEALKNILEKFLIIVRDAQDIITKHCNVGFLEKIFLSNKFEDDFKGMNRRLKDVKESFSVIIDIKIVGDIKEISAGMNNMNVAVKEANEDVKNAVEKAKEGVIIAIKDVQKAKDGKVLEIPTIEDSAIMLNENPGSLGRASGTLNKFQNVELIYSKEIVEDRHKLEIMWKLSSCEGILTLYGLCNYRDKLYMVTEKPDQECPTLDIVIKRKTFFRNWGVIRSMSLELANAIGFMHVCKILHKAICTTNICMVGDRHVRIYGFENSRLISTGTDNKLTLAREQIIWTAPERLKVPKPDYDEKCDIYSFGAVMWSLATHEVPYDAMAPKAIIATPLKVPDDVPKEFAVIVEGCIDRDVDKRWKIDKVIEELSKLVPENLKSSS